MKRIIFIVITILLLSFSINNFTDNIIYEYYGKYFIDKCYGRTAGGSSICFEYNIEIYNDNGKMKAKYSLDGFQTMRRFNCYTEIMEDRINIFFDNYDKDDIHYSDDHKKGELLFYIKIKHNKYFISNFKSPVDGKLIKKIT